jgi:tagatose 1,6-diphosphate aldolase
MNHPHDAPAFPFPFIDPGPLVDGELSLTLLRNYTHRFATDVIPGGYEFLMWAAADRELPAGGIRLRVGNDTEFLRLYCGHIGYDVHPIQRGRHFAERSVRLLLPLARHHGVRELWITCNPDNVGSRRTCERLGMELVEIVRVAEHLEMFKRGETHKCRYRLDLQNPRAVESTV